MTITANNPLAELEQGRKVRVLAGTFSNPFEATANGDGTFTCSVCFSTSHDAHFVANYSEGGYEIVPVETPSRLAVGDKVIVKAVYYSSREKYVGQVGTVKYATGFTLMGEPIAALVEVRDEDSDTDVSVYATAVEPIVEPAEEPLAEWEQELLNAQAPVAEEPTYAFAVGDKVRVASDIFSTNVPRGTEGTVTEVKTSSGALQPVFVVPRNGTNWNFYGSELEAVVEPPVATFADYAEGDTVKVVNTSFDDWAENGVTGTVTEIDSYVRVHLSIHKDARSSFPFLPTEIEKVDPVPAMLEKVDEVVKALTVSSVYWAPLGTPVETLPSEPIEGEIVTEPTLREQVEALEPGSVVAVDSFGKQVARIKAKGGDWVNPGGMVPSATFNRNTLQQADAGTLSILFSA